MTSTALLAEIEKHQRLFDIPGLSFRLMLGGEEVLSEDLGLSDRTTGEQLDKESVFRIGCISKPIAAIALLILAEKGKVNLESPVGQYFPERLDLVPLLNNPALKVKHLISFCSGLERGDYWQAIPDDEVVFECLQKAGVLHPPGERFKYSNWAYFLVQQLVEKVSGVQYEAFVKEALLLPAGMTQTFDPNSGEGLNQPLVKGHWRGWYFGNPDIAEPQIESPLQTMHLAAGGFASTADDLLRFVKLLMTGKGANGQEVLSAHILTQLETPQTRITTIKSASLGFFIDQFKGYDMLYFPGTTSGYSSFMAYFPQLNVGAVVLANQMACHAVLRRVLALLFEHVRLQITADFLLKRPAHWQGDFSDPVTSDRVSLQEDAKGQLQAVFQEGAVPLYGRSAGRYIQLGGDKRAYMLQLLGQKSSRPSIGIGPALYQSKSSKPGGAHEHMALNGWYRSPVFGQLRIYHRGKHLMLDWGIAYETVLEPVTDTVFIQKRGAFAGEKLVFSHYPQSSEEPLSFLIGTMRFEKVAPIGAEPLNESLKKHYYGSYREISSV